ncbi:MAG: conjugal transfer protein TraX [Lachnospiraceae bacterium]|nr:conjugal transfer protein TraX [Lachnospiraceae bacterium]
MESNLAERKEKGLTASTIKWIAIITMFIDHATVNFMEKAYPQLMEDTSMMILYFILREIGRLAFPIFCFFIVEGAVHTKNIKKYLFRLFIFGLISEIPFDLVLFDKCFDWSYQNVYFTMFFGLLAIVCMQRWKHNWFGQMVCVFSMFILADLLRTDYGGAGVLLIVVFYVLREQEKYRVIFGSIVEVGFMGILEIGAVFAFIPLHFYNGQRGKQNKYMFYLFYPLHLLLLLGIRGCL